VNEIKASGDLLSIGEFAKRSRLSHKALRLYDASGLLSPAFVDEQSAYRYYCEAQLEKAELIGLLQQLEMPLNQIAEVLTLPGAQASQVIARFWLQIEAKIKTKRQLVHTLENYLQGKGETMYNVLTRETPEYKMATIRRRIHVKELGNFISEAIEEIYTYAKANGVKVGFEDFVIYEGRVNDEQDGPIEVCVPFEGTLEPAGRIAIRLEPAHHIAYTRITKAQCSFPGILQAYDDVYKWLKDNGKAVSGNSREIYWADWSEAKPDDPAVDIAFPFN
jgi:DNA-binding transcriptional MerR regulator